MSNTCVAFAAGGGVAPVVSLVKRLLDRARRDRVIVFYGVPDAEHAEPLAELLELKDRHLDRLSLGFVTSRDTGESELLTGQLDGAKVGALATRFFEARSIHEFYVCGPTSLADEVRSALGKLGVEPLRIHAEDAGDTPAAPQAAPEATSTAPAANETAVSLVMDGRRRTFNMLTGAETILDAAARAGIELPYSCKAGVCATCRTKLVSGKVDLDENYALEDWELEQGFILACQARARTPEIELTYDEK